MTVFGLMLLLLAWVAASAIHARLSPSKDAVERRKREREERRAARRRARIRVTDDEAR